MAFAEEHGIAHLGAAAVAGSRDANRFMARLALTPFANLRLAPTQVVKAKLTAAGPVTGRAHGSARHLTKVVAARRSMRRERTPTAG